MKLRRRIACLLGSGPTLRCNYTKVLRQVEWGSAGNLRCTSRQPPMSALGQKQTSRHLQPMSALPPIADIGTQPRNVCFVPIVDKVHCNEKHRYSITWSAIARSCGGNVNTATSQSRRI